MWEAVITSLVNNLGGTAGFGEFSLARNDDSSTPFIDLRPIFGSQGINFFGHYYTGFYLNNNGSVTFNTATSSFTPTAITGSTSNPVIAAYWADIDTRGGTVTPTAGGTSTGSNLLWYDLDATTHTFTATWDDVGYYSSQTNKLNAFQISIHEINDLGDFDIIYRYENIDWTTGSASGGSNGLGGTPARAGYSAGNGTDYFELPQSGNQAALLALESASNVGTPGTFVFSVRNGVPTVGITAVDASIDEGDGTDARYVSIPVFLTEASASTVTVHYSTANGAALAGQDYVAQSGTLTFAPGVTQQNILVAVIGDAVIEGSEAFTVTLSDPSEGASILDGSATGTILDDDSALSIAAASADAAEGDGGTTAFTFTVTRTGDTTRPATASWTVSGPAVDGADFAGGTLPSGTVTLGIGETSKTITLHVAGDTQLEGDESFIVTLSDPGPGTSLGMASATGVIHNDDFSPASLSIAATGADKPEGQSGSTEFTFTVTRTGDLSAIASAHWAVDGEGVNGADFTGGELPSGVVSFAGGESSKVITVDVAGDTAVESNEAFTVTLSSPSAGAVLGTASANGVIRNDDASLSIAATSADKAEGQSGGSPFTFTVTRTGDLSVAASAGWTVSGPAVSGADFVGGELPSGVVNFAVGESSKVVTVDVAGDTAVESDETFTVTLSDPSVGAVIDTASADGVIGNDDASLSIAATCVDKAEGQSESTAFTFAVTRTGDLGSAMSAHWAVGGEDVNGADFVGGELPSGVVNFAVGESSKVVTVDVAGDTAVESNEAFAVTLSDPSAGTVIGTAAADGVIRNDDASLSIAADCADKAEGDLGATAFTFTVTRVGDLSGAASASWAVTDEGTIDSDFIPTADLLESADLLSYIASSVDLFFPGTSLFGGLLPSGSVDFAAGESTKTVTVWTLGETAQEGDESFTVTLSDASAGTVIDTSSAVGAIRNDDGPPAGLVSISDVTVTEGDDETQLATFTVTRTGGTSAFSVDYASADGTAMVADGDYAATFGTLHFGEGVDVQTFSVLVNGDSVFESDEIFFVDLSGATHGAVLGIGTGVGTILNDDVAPGPTTLVGTPGDDNLIGGPADDIIIGLAGSDILGGGAGNDSLDGGLGTDLLIGGAGADTFVGGDGDDYLLIDSEDTAIDGGAGFDSAFALTDARVTLDMGAASIEWAEGNVGADTFDAASQTSAVYIYGDDGNDMITGSAFGDYLDGGDGDDTLAGGDGDDLLFGNGGSDILLGQGGDDYIIEFGGDSLIDGGAGFDSLFVWSDTGVTLNLATASIEWVQGSVLDDDMLNGAGNTVNTFLYGWGGSDALTGGSGDDYIAGGTGNDILTGGAGNDTLIGEAGVDRYVYTAATWGTDTIHSFDTNGEKLDFTAVAGIDSFADFTAYEWDPGNLGYNSTTLFHTDGGTTSAITLIGVQVASLSDSDFLFA